MNKKEKTPKITVVISQQNGYHLMKPCLDSITKIKYSNVDYIIIDDGSTDDSAKRLKKKFPFISLIYTGKDIQYQGAYNIGIRHALKRGTDFIFLGHSDTYDYSEDFFEEVIKAFLEDSKIGLICTSCRLPLGELPPRIAYNFDRGGRWIDKFMDIETNIHSFGPFYRKEVFEDIGVFDEDFLCFEDFDLLNRLRKAGYSTYFVPEVSFIHIGGGTANFRREYRWWYNRTKSMYVYLRKYCSENSYEWRMKKIGLRMESVKGIYAKATEEEQKEIERGIKDGKRDGINFYEKEGLVWKL